MAIKQSTLQTITVVDVLFNQFCFKNVKLMMVEVSNEICLIKDLIGFAGAKWVGWGKVGYIDC